MPTDYRLDTVSGRPERQTVAEILRARCRDCVRLASFRLHQRKEEEEDEDKAINVAREDGKIG